MKTNTITSQKFVALATLSIMGAGTLGTAGVALAGSKGRRNTTIGLGAITAYGILKKKKGVAIAGGLGTAYAYTRYRKAKKTERRGEARRIQWYKNRYGRNWRSYYRKDG
jgi:hypothetical protein